MRTRFLVIGGRAALGPFCRQTIPLLLRLSFLNLCLQMKQNESRGRNEFASQSTAADRKRTFGYCAIVY